MTPERIAELRALCEAATQGPWHVDKYDCYIWGPSGEMVADSGGSQGLPPDAVARIRGAGAKLPIPDNMALIAAARAALPEALREIERLRERLEIGFAYQQSKATGEMVRVPCEDMPDGIECRDETIRLLDRAIDELRAENAKLRATLSGDSRK